MQTGSIDFQITEFNLDESIQNTIHILKHNLVKKNIKLNCNVDENLNITADQNMINTVVRNILSNAIKFTRKDGEISIEAHRIDDNLKISVTDNGIGMTEEAQKNLFNEATSKSTQGTNAETGSGLGLLICKEFIQRHNGKIWVHSEPNVGSTFNIELSQ